MLSIKSKVRFMRIDADITDSFRDETKRKIKAIKEQYRSYDKIIPKGIR